jgi:hypothetical protein
MMGEVVQLRPLKKYRVEAHHEAIQIIRFTVEAADEAAAEAMVNTIIGDGKVESMPGIETTWYMCDCCPTKWQLVDISQ